MAGISLCSKHFGILDTGTILLNPTTKIDNSGSIPIEHYTYDKEDNSVSVEHLKYIGGEHVWFNPTFEGFSTAELTWNFVSQYDINGKRLQ